MMKIETQQLEYFAVAAECGSMSKAADRLFVSQQALSRGIQSLEKTVGVELFKRTQTGVSLTDFGNLFFHRSSEALHKLKECESAREDYFKGVVEHISVGANFMCSPDQGGSIGMKEIMSFRDSHPGFDLVYSETRSDDIQKMIIEERLDFGIAGFAEAGKFDYVVLDEFPLAVIMSKRNMLSRKPTVALNELRGNEVVMPSGSDTIISFITSLGESNSFKTTVSPIKTSPCDKSEFILNENMMLIVPLQHARRTTSPEKAAVVPLCDRYGKPMTLSLPLIWKKNRVLTDIEREFVDYLVELYRTRNSQPYTTNVNWREERPSSLIVGDTHHLEKLLT